MTNTGNKDTRSGFGAGLYELGTINPNVVALCADLIGSLKMEKFAESFPDRFFQTGIAEANMMGVAAGLAVTGRIPFAGTFAEFATGRVYDQLRQSVCYSQANVKIAASHAGITLGEDGATHQTMEDLALARALPHMTVVNPCDYNQTRLATLAAARWEGPLYLRFGRPSVPNFTPVDGPFEIGKAWMIQPGEDLTILATGHLVWEALEALKILAQKGIRAELINIHTISPLDEKAIIESARKTGAVVTAEEHLVTGGLGEAVAGLLARHNPVPMRMVAMEEGFGQSGTPRELMDLYGLNAAGIVAKASELRLR
ncbi:MAG: transketolase C-terminal domain-containing protein, partial [Bacteroidales bacterium]|jgi:transketolase|nr:transketolase C-terminal domain-containing protein [Bacteroidales bacterium]MDD2771851.1 transketolase C-terminal domain-containing protein [Bacteroidales bacterium]MDD4065348.1 transketolase C-terminal domain-containing protein [Bacteroidales bacterium]MDD5283737.1 transketolase C-terminal domain-containing protein [Bacteroidales bacterium]MDY0240414.1 transketolase C-terminal domain-containing protein [Bacteroidales bacterium]